MAGNSELRISRALCAFIFAIAALVLTGWTTGVSWLERMFPDGVAMNPTTAASFILLAFVVWNTGSSSAPAGRRGLHAVLLGIVFIPSATRLVDVICGTSMDMDLLLFHGRLMLVPGFNHIAPNTALNFLLCSVAIALQWRRGTAAGAQWVAGLAFLIAYFGVTGYLFEQKSLYTVSTFFPMAFITAICFFALSVAIPWADPTSGIVRLVNSGSPGGVVARGMLPVALIAPVLLSWIHFKCEQAGALNPGLGSTLVSVITAIVIGAMVLWTSQLLHRIDARRIEAERSFRQIEERFRAFMNYSPTLNFMKDHRGRFVYTNETFNKSLGIEEEEVTGKRNEDLFAPEIAAALDAHDREALAAGKCTGFIEHRPASNGATSHYLAFRFPITEPGGASFIAGISVDVTEQKKLEREAMERTQELKRANEELEQFSYSVSHDLRTPLRHIEGFVNLLKSRAGDDADEKNRHYMKVIADSTKEMGQLIDDLLSFSRMARAEMQHQPVDLNSMLEETCARLEPETRGRNIVWKKSPLPRVYADPAMLKQVFVNLISNAIKYTGRRDPAVIETGVASETEDEVVIFVRDNGAGFNMAFSDKLFGVFQRLHRAEEFEGTGIGLANVRRIINRHGGRVWAEAEVDKGATFFFSLAKKSRQETIPVGSAILEAQPA